MEKLFRLPKEEISENPLHQLRSSCLKENPIERATIDEVLVRLDLIHRKMFNTPPDLDIFEITQRGLITLLEKKYTKEKTVLFDLQDSEKVYLIERAIMCGSLEIAERLLQQAKTEAKLQERLFLLLQYAIKWNRPSFFKTLKELEGVNETITKNKENLFDFAVITRNVEILDILSLYGIQSIIHNPIKDVYPAIHLASFHGSVEVINWLVEHGANSNMQSEFGTTPLHFAVTCGQKEAVIALLKNGADQTITEANKWLPIHTAAATGDVEIMKILLDAKNAPDINSREMEGKTPLHIAVCYGPNQINMVKFLIQVTQVNPNAVDNYGCTPLHYAEKENIFNILLQKANPEIKNNLQMKPKEAIQSRQEMINQMKQTSSFDELVGPTDKELRLIGKEEEEEDDVTEEELEFARKVLYLQEKKAFENLPIFQQQLQKESEELLNEDYPTGEELEMEGDDLANQILLNEIMKKLRWK